MEGFAAVARGLDITVLTGLLLSVVPILLCLTLHELAHGAVAFCFGDDTAKNEGRLTLNPLKHLDLVGFLMMLFVRFGWAKPVPVDVRNFRRPRLSMAIVALAGPMSNFLLTALIFVFFVPLSRMLAAGGVQGEAAHLLIQTAMISVYLGVFNLLPIPPLDGSKMVGALVPERYYYTVLRYERFGMIALMALVWFGVLMGPLQTLAEAVLFFLLRYVTPISEFLF